MTRKTRYKELELKREQILEALEKIGQAQDLLLNELNEVENEIHKIVETEQTERNGLFWSWD